MSPSSKCPCARLSLCLLACVALAALTTAGRTLAAPVDRQGQEQEDFTDESTNEFDEGPSSSSGGLQREPSELASYGGFNGQADFNAGLQADYGAAGLYGQAADQYPVSPAASSSPTLGANHAFGENNMSTDDDSDADEADIESSTSTNNNQALPQAGVASSRARARAAGRRQQHQHQAESELQSERDLRQWSQDGGAGLGRGANLAATRAGSDEQADADADADADAPDADAADSDAQDSNIANAKVEMTAGDMVAAAGHHHHHGHGHGAHGWLEMGAKTGKKGAFKWHDKHPVGGKGK